MADSRPIPCIHSVTTDIGQIPIQHCDSFAELQRNLTHSGIPQVTQQDSTGAINAILRLQKVYNLSIADLARGVIYDRMSEPLKLSELVALGNQALRNQDYHQCIAWFEEALVRGADEPQDSSMLLQMARAHFLVSRHDRGVAPYDDACVRKLSMKIA